jgi:uncharacterized membrane protein YoaK (UPF0700 family)
MTSALPTEADRPSNQLIRDRLVSALGGANRKTPAQVELYRFWPTAVIGQPNLAATRNTTPSAALARLLLAVQFLLLTAVLAFSVVAKPSSNPHGVLAGIAAMIAVSAMATQYALLRLALPGAISTAVMTGNLANTVLSIMDALSRDHPPMGADGGRLKRSLHLLFGFLLGCAVAAAAIFVIGEWTWSLPPALAALVAGIENR